MDRCQHCELPLGEHRRAHARFCSPRCRAASWRAVRAAREEAFAALLAHGAEIRAAIGEGRDPDPERLAALAAAMDEACDRASVLRRVSK